MSTAAPATNGGTTNRGLRRYAEVVGSRRAARRTLGPDVDPDFCLTDFLFCLATKNYERVRRVYGAERTKAPLGQASGPAGGYLVPTELRLDLMADVAEEAIVRPRATVVPMSSSALLLPLPDAGTAPAAAGISPFHGGVSLQWTAEGNTRPETEPAWRQVALKAWDLTGYALESNPLYQDGGTGLENYLRRLFARSVAWHEDYAYLTGDGVGKPLGVVNAPAAKQITRQTASQFTQQDAYKMSQALLPASWPRAVWVVSVSIWEWLVKLGSTQWQINQPFGDGPHFVLNGRPGFVSEKLPAVGTQGDVVLFDPLLYVIGDRGAVEIAHSDHEPTAFLKNQCVWRVTYRGDGQPWLSRTVTLQDAATTVSPYVVLV